jgi:mRNA-degrading endonuclease RelE of RelBE toxin-antitoxin system
MTYRIVWSPSARRQLEYGLPEQVAAAVWALCTGPLALNPQRLGKQLRFDLEGWWSARRGDYRVVYRIRESEAIVEIGWIKHRGEAYRRR